MKYAATIILLMIVTGCASPARNLIDAQIHDLSDDQLCHYQNNYRSEYRVDAEIRNRGVNCNRYFRECLAQGNEPGTDAMAFCIDILRQNERLRDEPAYDRFDVFGYHDYDRLRSVRR
jgi:hypothetical protein